MTRLTSFVLLTFAFAGIAAAQPVINGIQNNYSYLLPNTPNYAIAQGSIVILYGANMAPAGLLTQGFNPGLNRNLGGVSVKTTVAGTTTEAIPYYVSATQIAAILPSATPVGTGSMTVTYNGQTSPPFAVTIVQGAFGILTMGGNGLGNAAVYNTDFQYITPLNSANPLQIVFFWGTGQGPDPNDETQLIAAPQNLANLPFEFYIGNKPARVVYHGRSTYPGLDQIGVEIPEGVSGCYTSAYAKTGDYMSNFVSIPVAETGRVCADWFSSAPEVQDQLGTGKGELNLGWYYLGRFTMYTPGAGAIPENEVIQDSATAQFTRITPFHASNWGSVGGFADPGCIVTAWPVDSPFAAPFVKRLDAGPQVLLTLPDGTTRTLAPSNVVGNYAYSANNTTSNAALYIPDAGGTFKFRAPGGVDVGVAEADLPVSPLFVWNEYKSLRGVNLREPLIVTWNGGQPNSFVLIQGASISGDGKIVTTFGCTEHIEAGSYTVPRNVIASMIASGRTPPLNFPMGQLVISNYSFPARFTAQGLDHGSVTFYRWFSSAVHFE